MKKILQVVFALTFVFISMGFTTKSANAFMLGCSSTSGFSVTTGSSCNVLPGCSSNSGFSTTTGQSCNLSTLPVGCSSTQGYSPTTGIKCDSEVNTSLPPGCTSTSAYSTTTGQSCVGNFPLGCTSNTGYSTETGSPCNGMWIGTTTSISLANLSVTSLTPTSATLNGNLLLGAPANVSFIYGNSPIIYGNFSPVGNENPTQIVYQFSNGTFSAQIYNLTPNTTYQFYALANNTYGKVASSVLSFTTPLVPGTCATGQSWDGPLNSCVVTPTCPTWTSWINSLGKCVSGGPVSA